MNCSRRLKATFCLAATMTMILAADFNIADAVSLSTEKGVAGISLSLDKICFATNIIDSAKDQNLLKVLSLNEESSKLPLTASDMVISELINDDLYHVAEEPVPVAIQEEAPVPAALQEEVPAPAKKEVKVSQFEDVGVSIADNYVNIRKEADTESEVMGKLYKGCAATILETKDEWVKIKSGNVKGYIKAEYLAIGFDAEELIDKYATKYATVNTTTLKVRDGKSVDAACITMIPQDETYEVIKEYDNWVKIAIDDQTEADSIKGYVSREFVDITVEFEHAISVEEEKAELERAAKAAQAEQEQLARLNNQQQSSSNGNNSSNNNSSNNNSSNNNSSNNNSSNNNNSNNNSSNNNSSGGSSQPVGESPSGSGSGSEIANYALKFVGNPYVYGGTSLTNGTDCSGFTQSVYRSFGKSIPRDSRSQAAGAGREVSLSSLQAGDLVFYTGSSGSVNHVALYIGGGQVVHASTPKSGIKVSKVNYRQPAKARRVTN